MAGISSLAVASDGTLYVARGDACADARPVAAVHDAIWRSRDAGATWTKLGFRATPVTRSTSFADGSHLVAHASPRLRARLFAPPENLARSSSVGYPEPVSRKNLRNAEKLAGFVKSTLSLSERSNGTTSLSVEPSRLSGITLLDVLPLNSR